MAEGKLAFYKGKLMTKEQIAKEQAASGISPQAPVQQYVAPAPVQQQYAPLPVFEQPQAMPLPPRPQPQQEPQITEEEFRAIMDEQRAQQQQAMLHQQQREYAQRIPQQMPQQMPEKLVTVFMVDNLKIEVEVDGENLRRFVEEINEAIGSQMPFQIGDKTINGRHILFYQIQ